MKNDSFISFSFRLYLVFFLFSTNPWVQEQLTVCIRSVETHGQPVFFYDPLSDFLPIIKLDQLQSTEVFIYLGFFPNGSYKFFPKGSFKFFPKGSFKFFPNGSFKFFTNGSFKFFSNGSFKFFPKGSFKFFPNGSFKFSEKSKSLQGQKNST